MNLHDIWLRSPLLRMVLPLLAGIYCADAFYLLPCCAIVIGLYVVYFFMRYGVNRHWNTHQSAFHIGIFYSILWIALGVFMSRSTNRAIDQYHALRFLNDPLEYAIRIADEPVTHGNRWKVQGEVLTFYHDSIYQACRGRVALTIEHDSL
ncbi:MAG: hypothetical protein ACKO7B_17030, partial [Flavobacteriales bacterium]